MISKCNPQPLPALIRLRSSLPNPSCEDHDEMIKILPFYYVNPLERSKHLNKGQRVGECLQMNIVAGEAKIDSDEGYAFGLHLALVMQLQ